MADTEIQVTFSAPGQAPLRLAAREVVLPGEAGVFTVLPGHTPFLTILAAGVVEVRPPEGPGRYFAVAGGIAEVRDDTIKILAEIFEEGSQIDPGRAQAARARAEERLKRPGEEVDLRRAELALQRSIARLGAHGKEGY